MQIFCLDNWRYIFRLGKAFSIFGSHDGYFDVWRRGDTVTFELLDVTDKIFRKALLLYDLTSFIGLNYLLDSLKIPFDARACLH